MFFDRFERVKRKKLSLMGAVKFHFPGLAFAVMFFVASVDSERNNLVVCRANSMYSWPYTLVGIHF